MNAILHIQKSPLLPNLERRHGDRTHFAVAAIWRPAHGASDTMAAGAAPMAASVG